MSCDCKCSVAPLHGAVGWSSVGDCGISRSFSLTFLTPEQLVILIVKFAEDVLLFV